MPLCVSLIDGRVASFFQTLNQALIEPYVRTVRIEITCCYVTVARFLQRNNNDPSCLVTCTCSIFPMSVIGTGLASKHALLLLITTLHNGPGLHLLTDSTPKYVYT